MVNKVQRSGRGVLWYGVPIWPEGWVKFSVRMAGLQGEILNRDLRKTEEYYINSGDLFVHIWKIWRDCVSRHVYFHNSRTLCTCTTK